MKDAVVGTGMLSFITFSREGKSTEAEEKEEDCNTHEEENGQESSDPTGAKK